MKRLGNFYSQYSLYIHAALLATHTNHHDGFRQKDLKFYIELLVNWVETSFHGPSLQINNNQIKRTLEDFIDEGLIKLVQKTDKPTYKLQNHGVLELAKRLVDIEYLERIQDFFFLYHFIYLYSSKLNSLVSEGSYKLPPNFQIELSHLFNPQTLLNRQKERIQLLIDKLEQRIHEAYEMSDLAMGYLNDGMPVDKIVQHIEKKYPYQLNNQRKMTELFKEISTDIKLIEITQAPKIRAKTLWEPLLKYYQDYLAQLNHQEITS